MRLCGNSITFRHYTAEEACQRSGGDRLQRGGNVAAASGWLPHAALLLKQFREFAAELGLELWGYNAVGADYFQPFGSQENYDRRWLRLEGGCRSRAGVGRPGCDGLGGPAAADSDMPDADLLAVLVELFTEAIDYARPKGARFTAEPHPFTLGMDNDFMKQLCDQLGSRALRHAFRLLPLWRGPAEDLCERDIRFGIAD